MPSYLGGLSTLPPSEQTSRDELYNTAADETDVPPEENQMVRARLEAAIRQRIEWSPARSSDGKKRKRSLVSNTNAAVKEVGAKNEETFSFKLVSNSKELAFISLAEPTGSSLPREHALEDTPEEEQERARRVRLIAVDEDWIYEQRLSLWPSPKPHKIPRTVITDKQPESLPALLVTERPRLKTTNGAITKARLTPSRKVCCPVVAVAVSSSGPT